MIAAAGVHFFAMKPFPRFACLSRQTALALVVACLTGGAHIALAADAAPLLLVPEQWEFPGTDPGVFAWKDGETTAQRSSFQTATMLSKGEFENFSLDFEFRLERWCELILALHAPWNGAYTAGLEVLLSDSPGSAPTSQGPGALLGRVAPSAVTIRKNGEWNTASVRMEWPRFVMSINGTTVQDIDLSAHEDLKWSLRQGRIAFRDLLGWGFTLRNLHLTPLVGAGNEESLFNGRDLSGWKDVRPGKAKFRVADGTLIAENGGGYIQHERLAQDFDLRLYYRTTPTANGGVFFRWLPDDSDRGNEIQILDVPETVMPSGSIYSIERADPAPIRPGEWNLLQIHVNGTEARTRLNGHAVAATNKLTKVWPGLITIQMHKENSRIEFRDIYLAK